VPVFYRPGGALKLQDWTLKDRTNSVSKKATIYFINVIYNRDNDNDDLPCSG